MSNELNFDVSILTSDIMKSLNIPIANKKNMNSPIHTASVSKLVSNVKVEDLVIDLSYQRKPNADKVSKIIRNFDPNAIGVLICSIREDGIVAVIDGGHRVAALNAMGLGKTDVRCLVFFDLTIQQEAEMFTTLNDNRTKPKTSDIFKSKVVAGDPDATSINKIIEAFGLKIANNPGMNNVRAIGTLTNIYKREGEDNVVSTFETLISAFDSHSTTFSDSALLAVSKIYSVYGLDKVNVERLIAVLRSFGNTNMWINTGNAVAKTMNIRDKYLGMVLCAINEYNKKLRSNRLDITKIS